MCALLWKGKLQVFRLLPQNMDKTMSYQTAILAARAPQSSLCQTHRQVQQSLPQRLRTVQSHIQRWTAWGAVRLPPNLQKQFLGYFMHFESKVFFLSGNYVDKPCRLIWASAIHVT